MSIQENVGKSDSGKAALSYSEARHLGLKYYFTGKPCHWGHVAPRFSSNGKCVDCRKAETIIGKENKKQYDHARCLTNKEHRKALAHDWYMRNKHTERFRVLLSQRNRIRYIRKTGGVYIPYSLEELKERFALFHNCCAYCGTNKERIVADHFIALAKGGIHAIQNIVPACVTCNSSKNCKNPEEWYPEQKFFSEERWDKILGIVSLDIKQPS